jgi:DNA-binding transcriptional LysR family regulator
MYTRQLQAFCEVVDRRSLSHAARAFAEFAGERLT